MLTKLKKLFVKTNSRDEELKALTARVARMEKAYFSLVKKLLKSSENARANNKLSQANKKPVFLVINSKDIEDPKPTRH